MASYKSHFGPPTRPEPRAPSTQRAPSTSRLPTRSVTPTSQSQPRPTTTTSTTSKLRKKPTRDNVQGQPGKTVSNKNATVIPATSTQRPRPASSKSTPIVPRGNAGMNLPRQNPQVSVTSRLPKYEGTANTRTPSLISGSSASTIDSPRSVLRRKQSSIGRSAPVARPGSMSSQDDLPPLNTVVGGYNDPFTETVLGISIPPPSNALDHKDHDHSPYGAAYSPLDTASNLGTDHIPHNYPYANSATPSTRYSESPTAFSHVSTPTSMSSYSPGIPATHKPTLRIRQASPLNSRPPVTRRKTEDVHDGREQRALSSVRESSTSSSSASTVRMVENAKQRSIAREPLPAPPQSPPSSSTALAAKPLASPQMLDTAARAPLSQVPPEFAHLADPIQEKAVVMQDKIMVKRPVRPSRDGTPDISSLREPSPIIQSNMSSLPSHHRRQSSSGSRTGMTTALQNDSSVRLAMPSRIPSRNPSPNPNLAAGFPRSSSRAGSSRGPTPDLASDTERNSAKARALTTPSPSKPSRFGFFSRRTKTEPASTPAPTQPEKRLRKGPAAGTGYEGYGKFAGRGRSGSTTSGTGSVGRSPSSDSRSPSFDRAPSSRKSSEAGQVDDFFLDRLNPVVIRGTGGSTELCRSPEQLGSTSSLASTLDQRSTDIRVRSGEFNAESDVTSRRPSLLPSALPEPSRTVSPRKRFGLGIRRPSESEEEKKAGFYMSSMGNKRPSRRSQLFGSKDSVVGTTSSITSTAASTDSVGTTSARKLSRSRGLGEAEKKKEMTAITSKPEVQPKLTRKWNFFQRAQNSASKKAIPNEPQETAVKLPPTRSVAHYALDPMDDPLDPKELESILREAKAASKKPVRSANDALEPVDHPPKLLSNRPIPEHVQSMLLPSPPLLPPSFPQSQRPASPQVDLRKEHQTEYTAKQSEPSLPEGISNPGSEPVFIPSVVTRRSMQSQDDRDEPFAPPSASLPRPSRLAQVGRIPQVISQRQRRPSVQSFSRPFAPTQPLPAAQISRSSVDMFQVPLIAESSVLTDVYPSYGTLSTPFKANFEFSDGLEETYRPGEEFMTFPPRRKDSEMSSSSSGIWSFLAPTAVIPLPGAPLGEDEVWNEYNDLIDDVLSPETKSIPAFQEAPSLDQQESKVNSDITKFTKGKHNASNSITSSQGTNSVHLRRSRLLSALHSSSPHASLTISDVLASYGESHPSVVDTVTGRLSFPSLHRMSSGSGPARNKSIRSSVPPSVAESRRQSCSTIFSDTERPSNKYGDSKLMEIAGDHGVSMADLRFGALMTSKWLSFGRVLFSPVHFELKDPAEDRILVVDGLGKGTKFFF